MTISSLIVAEGLTKTYRTGNIAVDALKNLNFSIPAGGFVSFVGPSGSGKTTLLNLIGCLDKLSEGQLLVSGLAVASLDGMDAALFRGKHIGFIFQIFNLIPVLTVFENVEYPVVMVQNVPTRERRKRVSELREAVGMMEHGRKLTRGRPRRWSSTLTSFEFFGGVYHRGIYDNLKTVVNKVLSGKDRNFNDRFAQLSLHYLFEPTVCTPAAGWEKGQMENQIRMVRRRFFVPFLRLVSPVMGRVPPR